MHSALRQPLLRQLFCTNFLLNVPVYNPVSWLAGRYLTGREPWVICLASLIAAVGMLTTYLSSSVLMSTIGLLIINLALVCTFVTTFTLSMKYFPVAMTGSIVGLLNAGGVLGGFVGPVVMGY